MQVHVAKAELWSLPVDAVVNPANSLGIMGGGIGGSLRRQGGDVIQQAAMAAAPIAVGAALVTTAGQLPARNVIHVPTMEEPGMMIGAENVRRAARAALIAADRNNFKTIAIPASAPTSATFRSTRPRARSSRRSVRTAGRARRRSISST
jgi:O-acetyl-ADP-ribose deacetylase (regulator of RNase III)